MIVGRKMVAEQGADLVLDHTAGKFGCVLLLVHSWKQFPVYLSEWHILACSRPLSQPPHLPFSFIAYVLSHITKDSYLEEVMTFTKGAGVDVVLEMLANKNLANDMTVLAKGGRIAVIGNRGTIEIDPRQLMRNDGR
jgi:Zinc-binding dehydrogenase